MNIIDKEIPGLIPDKSHKIFGFIGILILCIVCNSGCETTKPKPVLLGVNSRAPINPTANPALNEKLVNLNYHVVSDGETLWRICRNYGVNMSQVIELNHIKDPNNIRVGEKIYLPKCSKLKSLSLEATEKGYVGYSEKHFIEPVIGKITLFYGQCRDGWVNKGLEFRARSRFVKAPKTGKVVFCGKNLKGYGNTLMIDHGDGFISVIAGNGKFLVKLGDFVKQGQAVLELDSIPSNVHFEIRKGITPVNPLRYLK